MIVITSLANARAEVAARRPARVISLLSEDESPPDFGLPKARHLNLHVSEESCARSISRAAKDRAEAIIRFMSDWDGEGDVLVHCNRGIARSSAAAFIILCMREPQTPERVLAERLRAASPYADPCPMLVEYADEILGRDGRMADAACALSQPCAAISAPTASVSVGGATV